MTAILCAIASRLWLNVNLILDPKPKPKPKPKLRLRLRLRPGSHFELERKGK